MARTYSMASRDEARRRTREQILDAAVGHFGDAWYDDITLASVARAAGVSQQTVANHFGTKLGLYLAAVNERTVPRVMAARDRAVAGDVRSVVEAVVEDYETSGPGTVRALALAEREPDLAEMLAAGAAFHASWVAEKLAPRLAGLRGARRAERERLLAVALEARTWHQLRHGHGLSRDDTVAHLLALVEALLA
jgi:AcrR family transcriptional regulator